MTARPATAYEQWLARLEMTFSHRQQKTKLVNTLREGPLSVQRAFYPETTGAAHLYLLHPPAGIVSGDELHVAATLEENCQVLLTTPGANRFYRAREAKQMASKQCQFNRFTVADNAHLEFLPHETLVYTNANAFSHTHVYLDKGASYVGWDIACLGLPHIDQPFSNGQFTQTFSLYHNQKIRFHDRLALQAKDNLHHSRIGLAGHHVVGTMVLFNGHEASSNEWAKSMCSQIRRCIDEIDLSSFMSVTQLQGVVVVRYLGEDSEVCREGFVRIWMQTRPQVSGHLAVPPRIWYT